MTNNNYFCCHCTVIGRLNKRYDTNSTNDDISHITGDDENPFPHYFFPTRPRPKSALSKLGGGGSGRGGGGNYDSISVTSGASTPGRVHQKRHSIGGGETPPSATTPSKAGGGGGGSGCSTTSSLASASKKHPYHQLQQEQLYDNSEVNRIVVERSMEWNGE
jgi:hypothetical protein